MKNHRIAGFDLARAYAIFGMYIVNFNVIFGNYRDTTPAGKFLSLFSGNSSTLFVLLAGMGVSLLTNRPDAEAATQSGLRRLILRRSWFLFALGLLLYLWWPADILHFYGAYMHLAAFLLFVPNRWLLWASVVSITFFHGLLLVIPYEKGWNFDTLAYLDFWTIEGFLRNTIYNGWNPVFPWSAFFFFGMWLGRLDWQDPRLQKRLLTTGLSVFLFMQILQFAATQNIFSEDLNFYLTADYLPPFLPFMLSTGSISLALMVGFLWLGNHSEALPFLKKLAATGRMTLTHYIVHLTLGMLVLSIFTGENYAAGLSSEGISPLKVLAFSIFWFGLSIAFSHFWSKKFKNGPFEMLMRKVAG